jgi:hypothetical protein
MESFNGKPERMLLTAPEAAEALRISTRTLWGLTDRGEVLVIYIGRSVHYAVDDLKAWIDTKRRPAAAPTADGARADLGESTRPA